MAKTILRFLIVSLLYCFDRIVFATENNDSNIIYDQRQSGKYNIHVSIKDVAIIELDRNDFKEQSNSDPDYYYDDSDFTIKPLLSWIQALSSNTSIKPPSTITESTQSTNLTSLIHTNSTSPFSIVTTESSAKITPPVTLPPNHNKPMIPTTLKPSPSTVVIKEATKPTRKSTESPVIPKKSSSVVILGNQYSHRPQDHRIEYPYENGGEIPVQILEPILHPQLRNGQQHYIPYRGMNRLKSSLAQIDHGNSRVFNLKSGRNSHTNNYLKPRARPSLLGTLFRRVLTSFNDGDDVDK